MGAPYAAPPTLGRLPAQAIIEAGSATRARVHEQRQTGVLIGHDHDVIAAVVRRRSATSEIGTGGP
jgi:hypothetical protein